MAAAPFALRTLAAQVLLRVLPPLLLLLLLVGWWLLEHNARTLQAQVEQRLEQQLDASQTLLDEAVSGLLEQARSLAGNDLVWNGLIDTEDRYRYLPALFRSLRGAAWGEAQARYALLDFRGRTVLSNELPGYRQTPFTADWPGTTWLQQEDELVWLDRYGLLLLVPVRIHGFVEGWLELSLPPEELPALLRGWRSSEFDVGLHNAGAYPLVLTGRRCEGVPAGGCLIRARMLDGPTPLELRVGVPQSRVAEEQAERVRELLGLMGLIVLLVLIGIALATRMTAAPLARLGVAAGVIADSPDISTRLPEAGPLEVRRLARAINRSLDQLEESHVSRSELEASEAKYRTLVENAPIIIYRCELAPPWRMRHVSQGAERLCGYPSERFLEGGLSWGDLIVTEDLSRVEAAVADGVARGQLFEIEYRIRHADGNWLWVHEIGQPQGEGDARWLEGVITDISERKAAEEELARSNAELEQFAYAVSHDMRQPLRMVSGHLSLLQRMLGERLDGDEHESMRFAIEGARRMDQMIIALLEYSRVGRMSAPMAWLPSREAVDEALIFLGPALEESGGRVEVVGQWPSVCASRDELTRLLQNLIGNALKYRKDDTVPQITVTGARVPDGWRVEVADNGIGIPEGQSGRLFQVFSRVHKGGRFEGSGVGLALCRKIVEHHGGRIGVVSAGEGQGSTFWFELPQGQEGGE